MVRPRIVRPRIQPYLPALIVPWFAACSNPDAKVASTTAPSTDFTKVVGALVANDSFVPRTESDTRDGATEPLDVAINEVTNYIAKRDAGGRDPKSLVIQVNEHGEMIGWWNSLDISTIVAAPVGLVIEGLRMLVVEDADGFFWTDRAFDTFFVPATKKSDPPGLDDIIEIRVRYLAIDNFIEGRLRDSLGGDGGELSLQVSIAGLNDQGELLDRDFEFLDSETQRRRFPLLVALEATEEGRKKVESARELVKDARAELRDADRQARTKKILDDERNLDEEKRSRDRALRNNEVRVLSDLRRSKPRLEPAARLLLESARRDMRTRKANEIPTADELESGIGAVSDDEALVGLLISLASGSAKSDEKGPYEEVQAIRGLAQADRMLSREFTAIRPKAWSGEGTASVLIDSPSTVQGSETHFLRDANLVYRGPISQLSKLGGCHGMALSVLLLERDSDRIVEALELVQNYADERNLSVNAGGVPVEIAPLAQALGLIAKRIADEDVELKCIDLRFACDVDPFAAGPPILKLVPGTLLVTRNSTGREFGAMVAIEITKVK